MDGGVGGTDEVARVRTIGSYVGVVEVGVKVSINQNVHANAALVRLITLRQIEPYGQRLAVSVAIRRYVQHIVCDRKDEAEDDKPGPDIVKHGGETEVITTDRKSVVKGNSDERS